MGCVISRCCNRRPTQAPPLPDSTSSSFDLEPVLEPESIQEDCPKPPFQDKQNILTEMPLEILHVPSHNYFLEYSTLSHIGYYPDWPDRENQDSYTVIKQIQSNPNTHFFGIFDGHGEFGTQCSNFVKRRLVELLSKDLTLLEDPVKAYHSAFLTTNEDLHNSEVDDSESGTTAITVLVTEDKLYIANVGDSRAVIAFKEGDRILVQDLSFDQTPYREDECERVKRSGASILSCEQMEGFKDPNIQNWSYEESHGIDPPRLWIPNKDYPGTAFTRSLGDLTAEHIGVVAVPEVSVVQLMPDHLFFVLASDGVFDFLPSQTVVDMAASYGDPREACSAIARESYKLWLESENRTDDITIIIVHIRGLRSNSDRRSLRSYLSDQEASWNVASMNQSTNVEVPSPIDHRTMEVVYFTIK